MYIPLPLLLVLAALFVTVWFLVREITRVPNAVPVELQTAIEAAKLLKDWASWMTTVSTGVIGAVGVMLTPVAAGSVAAPGVTVAIGAVRQPIWAYWTVAMLLLSIVFAAWVLGSLPSIIVRLKRDKPSVHNDIYEVTFFSFVPVRFGVIAALQHTFFVLGLYCFALYVTLVPW